MSFLNWITGTAGYEALLAGKPCLYFGEPWYGDLLGAGSTVVGYECDGCDFTYVDGRPEPTGIDGTPDTFQILGTAPAAHFTHETATRPPAPGEPSELEGVASRVFGSRDPEHVERVRYGHAVLGTWTSEAGGTVVTSGCRLAGRLA